ncbi:MAG TPA: ankyrin repeat domain-containing protein [Candidatus Sulfotelmatobacter sp.]|jgi:ankyrin repeat protein|nr:ankyrin repeat domain-containing protein [Candidatus Sulfotelmatobacter sp.]
MKGRLVRALVLILAIPAAGCFFFGGHETPLGHAAAIGDTASMKSLLDAGADPNQSGAYRLTPLALAARTGHLDAIEMLLARGADPHRGSGFSAWPPLAHAIHKDQRKAALRLLDTYTGPSPDLSNALDMAAGYAQADIVAALLAHGVDPALSRADGTGALSLAAGGSFDLDWSYQSCDAHTATVRAILATAPDLRLHGSAGDAARKSAERHGCTELLALLR